MDWTFDLFMEDAKLYSATPMKGVYCRKNASERERFMVWLKNAARDFAENWKKEHDGKLYDRYDGYIGDGFFAREFFEMGFSDYYKDIYGQRPHLDRWFYVQALGLDHSEDIIRTFCAYPVEDAIEEAKMNRETFETY